MAHRSDKEFSEGSQPGDSPTERPADRELFPQGPTCARGASERSRGKVYNANDEVLDMQQVREGFSVRTGRPAARPFVSFGVAALSLVVAGWTTAAQAADLPEAVHPERLTAATPADGRSVCTNPPSLLWPPVARRDVRYCVRLSKDPSFPAGQTLQADDLPWAMFNPHRKLEPGVWHWKYAVRRGQDRPRWSRVFQFRVDESARVRVTPSPERFVAGCPDGHPRLLAEPDQVAELRRQARQSGEAKRVLRAVRSLIGAPLPDERLGRPKEKGRNRYEAKRFAQWSSKAFAAKLRGQAEAVARAYLLTGDESVGREAVRRGLHIASLDPDGVTARSVSDFADGSCMEAMAVVYDTCYDLLSPSERRQLREAMLVRARRFFGRMVNNLEARIFNAHVWQHILWQATQVAVALHGEAAEADLWLRYVYELWVARFPTLGGDDGGWANGLNYFGTNFRTLLEMPELFGRWTGFDFFDHPWYRNTPYYLLYCWPPDSACDGFGDGSERDTPPPASRGQFVLALAARFHDPYAVWYAKQVLKQDFADEAEKYPNLPPPKPPADLPLARLFDDIGVVSMHTSLTSAANDVFVAFRSSPYGSFNHMHCDQNSFHVLCGGQRVFAGSGYYIAYADDHYTGWYVHTRGQNSVLIDGRGQVRSCKGYGWVARYLHGSTVTYCLGDASAAYPDDAGLKRFRRQLVFLRPNVLVVYDDLQADHVARWSWLLHSPWPVVVKADTPTVRGPSFQASVRVLGSKPLRLSVDTRFDPPAVNWRKKKRGGKLLEYPDQYHVTVEPTERTASARFLAVLQLQNGTGAAPSGATDRDAGLVPVEVHGKTVRVGPWTIQAELDAARPPSLVVTRRDGTVGLAADVDTLHLGGRDYAVDGAALLVEQAGRLRRVCRDNGPPVPCR